MADAPAGRARRLRDRHRRDAHRARPRGDRVRSRRARPVALRRTDPRFLRPADVEHVVGDASKAREQLGWEPARRSEELVRLMVDADLELLERGEHSAPERLSFLNASAHGAARGAAPDSLPAAGAAQPSLQVGVRNGRCTRLGLDSPTGRLTATSPPNLTNDPSTASSARRRGPCAPGRRDPHAPDPRLADRDHRLRGRHGRHGCHGRERHPRVRLRRCRARAHGRL